MPRRIPTHHTLDVVKGLRPPNDLDFVAPFAAADLTGTNAIQGGIAFAGRCVSLNANGEFIFGVGNYEMPMFLFSNSDDADVKNDGGDVTTEPDAWKGSTPAGGLKAVVAIMGAEFETTEFDASANYAVNDLLKTAKSVAAAAGGDATNLALAGVLVKSSDVVGDVHIVGQVSKKFTAASPNKNTHLRPVLRFWGLHWPKVD